jgi:LysR family transcriptional regulator, nitrogen assimilation regulatory protein
MRHNDHQLRLFLAVAQSGSLRAAAEKLEITQPALSKQMLALEASLGAPLFRRNGRGMGLTPFGQHLERMMQPQFSALDDALERASGMALTEAGKKGGSINIATVSTLAIYLLPAVIEALVAEHPALRVSIHTASAPDVVERVSRGQADIGLVYDQAVNTDDFMTHSLFNEKLAGYCALSRPLLAADANYGPIELQQQTLILPPRPYALRRVIERELGGKFIVGAESNDILLSLDLASRGLGLAVLPSALPVNLLQAYPVQRVGLFANQLKRLVVGITPKARKNSEQVRLLLHEVKVQSLRSL